MDPPPQKKEREIAKREKNSCKMGYIAYMKQQRKPKESRRRMAFKKRILEELKLDLQEQEAAQKTRTRGRARLQDPQDCSGGSNDKENRDPNPDQNKKK